MKKDFKAIKWLYDELPELVADGVLSSASADGLRKRYGEIPKRDSGKLLLTLFSILGSVLVGLGLIMIVAHNWNELGRGLRTFVALAPLIASLCALGYAFMKNETREAIVEPLCAFQTLALGSAMAIIGQTYNLGGELSALLFFWCVAAIPLAYFFDSVATGAICVCILTWHFCVAESSLHGWQAWVALGAVAPYVAMTTLKGKGSARSAFLGWFAAIGSVVSLFGLVQNQVFNNGGLLLFGLAALFSAFHVWGSLAASPEQAAWRSPFRTAGAIGAGILLVLMSFDVWSNSGFLSGAIGFSVLCYLLLAGCLAGIALLILKKRPLEISFGLVGPLVFGALLLATPLSKSQGDVEFLLETLFSIATFALGVYSMLLGIKSDRFGSLNGGILLIFLWLMARFFMSDLDFLFKGLLFICLGAAFIAFNVFFFLRRRKAIGKEVAQ